MRADAALLRTARTAAETEALSGELPALFARRCPARAVHQEAQALGLPLEEIKDVLDMKDHGRPPCRRLAELGEERLRTLDLELTKLRAFRRALADALPEWRKETAVERICGGEFCDLIERLP